MKSDTPFNIADDEFEPVATPAFDHDAIREHVEMLHNLAAGCDGIIPLCIYGENPDSGRKTTIVQHFNVGDVDGMTAAALAYENHPDANVYAPLAVMRRDLPRREKGGERDVVVVLGGVIDSDADAGRPATSPVAPNYILETSSNPATNLQGFILFDRALALSEAKPLLEALHRASGGDHGTKDASHVWRVPGAANWPNAKKVRERNRPREPQPVRILQPWDGSLTSIDDLRRALAPHMNGAKPNGHAHTDEDDSAGWRFLWSSLPEAIKKLITAPPAAGEDLSSVAASVILSLIGRVWSDAKIAAAIRAHPQGVGARYAEGKDLEADIARLRGKSEEHPERDESEERSNAQPNAGSAFPAQSLEDVHSVFERWLGAEYDMATLDAVLAATAAERLGGDPAWLLVISGPGNAKTETIQSISAVADTHITSTIASEGALLSATSKKGRSGGATGGLLRKIGDRGLLVIKDFTSILSMDRNVRSTVLAALREIHDGRWERNVGTDGGRTLSWEGRIVVIGACTTAWDQAHAVVASMGDRFVVIRSNSHAGRLAAGNRAIRNAGVEAAMRKEMAEAVAGLIGNIDDSKDLTLTDDEIEHLLHAADIVTLARTSVETDYRGDIIDAHAPEMPTRFAKQISAIMRGGLAIGMPRNEALNLGLRCARDSIPQLRLEIMQDLKDNGESRITDIRRRLQKPWLTIDRALQALHALGLLLCREEEKTRGGREVQVRHYELTAEAATGADRLSLP